MNFKGQAEFQRKSERMWVEQVKGQRMSRQARPHGHVQLCGILILVYYSFIAFLKF